MGERTIEEARRDLLHVLPHIKLAMAQGETLIEGRTAGLGVIVKRPDGSGRVVAEFDGAILADIALLLGVADKPGWVSDEAEGG